MTAETIDLSVIIVNWNTRELLLRCLETLYSSLTGIRHEVIVVDNDSQDGSVGAVREQFPEATILANSKMLLICSDNIKEPYPTPQPKSKILCVS